MDVPGIEPGDPSSQRDANYGAAARAQDAVGFPEEGGIIGGVFQRIDEDDEVGALLRKRNAVAEKGHGSHARRYRAKIAALLPYERDVPPVAGE